MPLTTPSRKPTLRLAQRQRNSEPWPQSCISEKQRARNSTCSTITGISSQR